MERYLQAELMDDPGLDPEEHRRALRGLGRIHRLSLTVGHLWRRIRDLAARAAPLRVLDVACGGGDVAVGLWWRARQQGSPVQVVGLDRSAVAVRRARELAEERGATVDFRVGDALGGDLPDDCDVIMSSLFLHHLEGREAVELLSRLGMAARRRVVMDDLRRSLPGWLLAWAATRVLTRSRVVHVDGPRSVRAAFTLSEVREMASEAGLDDVEVRGHWPFHWILTGRSA